MTTTTLYPFAVTVETPNGELELVTILAANLDAATVAAETLSGGTVLMVEAAEYAAVVEIENFEV